MFLRLSLDYKNKITNYFLFGERQLSFHYATLFFVRSPYLHFFYEEIRNPVNTV